MEKFLETHNLLKMTHKEVKNPNGTVSGKIMNQ